MPSLFDSAAYTLRPSFLNNRIESSSPFGQAAQLSPEETEAMTRRLFNSKYRENRGETVYERIGKYAAASVVDLADTVASNQLVPGNPIERGDVWNFVGDYGPVYGPALKDFYERNQSGVETLSGVAGAVGMGYIAGGLVLPRIASAMANSTALTNTRLWQTGARINTAARANMLAAQREAALQGEMYRMWRDVAGRRFLANQAQKTAGTALFEEAAIVATLNSNEAIWSDEMSTNLFWGGIGIGLGGSLGLIQGRAAVRAYANSEEMIETRRTAIDEQAIAKMREKNPELAQLAQKDVRLKNSSGITLLALEARQATPEQATSQIRSRMQTVRSQAEQQMQFQLQKSTVQGLPGSKDTRFRVDDSAGRHLTEALKADPLILHGMDHVGVSRTKSIREVIDEYDSYAAALQKSKNPDPKIRAEEIKEGHRLASLQKTLIIDKRVTDAMSPEARKLADYRPNPSNVKTIDSKPGDEIAGATFRPKSGTLLVTDESFSIINPSQKGRSRLRLTDFEIDDMMVAVDSLRATMASMAKQKIGHKVAANADWEQIDSAIYYNRVYGGEVDWSRLGIQNIEEAELLSLKKKAEEIKRFGNDLGTVWDRLAYNLPEPSTAERIYDSKGDAFRGILDAAVAGAPIDQLKALKKQIDYAHGFKFYESTDDVPLTGNLFDFNRNSKGEWQEPVLSFYTNKQHSKPISAAGIEEWNAEHKIAMYHELTKPVKNPQNGQPVGFIPDMVESIVRTPEYQKSTDIIGLSDDQITGTGSFLRQAVGEVVTREMKFRDNQTMLSLERVRERANRMTDAAIRERVAQELGDVPAKLASSANLKSKVLVDQFMTFAYGKDLNKRAFRNQDGTYSFEISKNAGGGMLKNPITGKTIVVDELGMDFLTRFQRITSSVLADQNRVRLARGLRPLRQKAWYVPNPDLTNKKVAFVFDESMRVVKGKTIIASTQAEFDELIRKAHATLPAGHTLLSREAVESSVDVFDQAAMDWIDPNITAKPQGPQTGALGADRINPHSITDALKWVKDSMEQVGTDALAALYQSQISIAKVRGATEQVARGLKPQGFAGRSVDARVRTIWDEYQAVIYGKTLGELDKSISGSIVRPVEAFVNGALATTWPAIRHMAPSQISSWVYDTVANSGVTAPKTLAGARAAKTFDKLASELGPHMPFQSAMEYGEQTLKVVRPPEIRAIAQSLNKLSASLLLRYFELPHAAMNLIGMITTMPSIASSGKAPISAFFNTPTGRIGTVDSMKILTAATRDMMSNRRHSDWITMVKNGDASQQVAEFNMEMSLIKDRGSFNRFFFGKGSALGATTKAGKLWNEKGIDGYISIATDTTENWSRGWSHFVGLRIADHHGIVGDEARHAFAREIANAAIANYSPSNRPELYQSAFGSMFGLFMSWMQSYNQRLFRWAEHGQYKDVAKQMAMQSALFGISSNPGFSQIQNAMLAFGVGDTADGQDATLIDNIYAKFGPSVGATLAHGGLQDLGFVLYTRGDMNYRDLSLDPTRLMAGVSIMDKVQKAFRESAETLFSNYSVEESGRLKEVIARNMPNRVMKGTLSLLLNNGDEIDDRGQLVSENINFLESAVRMLGLRTTRQQAEIEAFYSNRQMQDREAARMDVLRNETRSLLRTPGGESRLQEVFDKYVKNGGRPDHFRTWIQDQVRAAEGTRGVNQMRKALANPKNQDEIWRYNIYGGQ